MSDEDFSTLPDGWIFTNLSELGTLINGDRGKNYPSKNAFVEIGIPFINAGHLQNGNIRFSDMNYITKEHFDILGSGKIQQNDILYCLRGSLGKAAIVKNIDQGAIASSLVIIRPSGATTSKYLFNFLVSPLGKVEISKFDNGSAQPNLSGKSVSEYSVPLAPLNEQKRIADKLDRLLAKVDNCRERLDRIPLILKHFRQSVLLIATSGQLTQDWRGENSNLESAKTFLQNISAKIKISYNDALNIDDLPENWSITNFGAVVSNIRGGSTAVPQDEPTEFPILRSSSVRPGFVDFKDVRYLSEKDSQNKFNYLCEDDLLFTRLSGSLDYVANCARVKSLNIQNIQYPDRLFRARVIPPMNASYCEFVFASPLVRKQIIEGVKSSAGHQRVSIGDITSQLIPIAPIIEQQEIVRRVEKLFDFADRLEARYQTARAQIDKLTPALLAKAFQGELVPQDPTDETAADLLTRIQQARANPENHPPKQPKTPRKPPSPKITMLNRKDIETSHLADILKNNGTLTAESLWNISKLSIDDFYDQLKDEELQGLLKETIAETSNSLRLLEAI